MDYTTHSQQAMSDYSNLLSNYLPPLFICNVEGKLQYYSPNAFALFKQVPSFIGEAIDTLLPKIMVKSIHENLKKVNHSQKETSCFVYDAKRDTSFQLKFRIEGKDNKGENLYIIELQKVSNIEIPSNLGNNGYPSNWQQLKYQAIVENTLDGIFLSDLKNGRAVECNRQAVKIFGATRKKLLEGGVLGFSPDFQADGQSSKEKLKKIKQELLKNGEKKQMFQWRYRKKNGQEFDADVVVNLIEEDDCKLWLTIIRDVSERINNERALQESYRKLHSVFNNTFQFAWLISKEGLLQEINETAINIFKVDPESIITKPIWETTWWKQNPLSSQQLQSSIKDVIREKKYVRFSSNFYDAEKQKHILDFSLKPLMNEENEIVQLILEGRDVTELVKSKEDTINRERLYRSIIRNTQGTTVLLFDQDLRFQLVEGSYGEMFGLQEKEILGKRIDELLQNNLGKGYIERFQEAIDGQLVIFEQIWEEQHYYIKAVPIRDFDGEINEAMIIVQDVTEIRRAEKELSQKVAELHEKNEELEEYIDSNLQLENFAYMASHDLKEPLRIINGFSQLIKRNYYNKLDQIGKEYIDFITDGSKRMDALISALLNYSKINSDEVFFEELKVQDLLTLATNNLMKSIIEHKVSVNISHNMPATIIGNRDRLVQLFQNLLANAIKFRNDEGQLQPIIHIRCENKEDSWQFSVADNGIGIENEHQDKIFLLFKKVHPKKHQGSGIGLATCRRIIEQHKGNIWVESEEGNGAIFHFTISKKLEFKTVEGNQAPPSN